VFQFHIGAIRSIGIGQKGEIVHMFQFHIGAIRSVSTILFLLMRSYSFNSILVQLEGQRRRPPRKSPHGQRFNSILVQLEVANYPVLGNGYYLEFQFHIGAIRSELGCELIAGMPSFNSILVQLEGRCFAKSMPAIMRFNSILVQLEVMCKKRRFKSADVSIPYWCN